MAQYLSDEWFAEMSDAGSRESVEMVKEVSLRETVTGTPFGDVTYILRIVDGSVSFRRSDEEVDVTFTQDYETAVALHKGELTIHDAFFAGKIRVSGHLNTLLEHSDALQGLTPLFDDVRAQTSY